MDCPKYIKEALRKRAQCAERFSELDFMIAEYLEKNNIEVEDFDIHGGCEAYVNPWDSSKRIYEKILEK